MIKINGKIGDAMISKAFSGDSVRMQWGLSRHDMTSCISLLPPTLR